VDKPKKAEPIRLPQGLNNRLRLFAVLFIETAFEKAVRLVKKWRRPIKQPLTIEPHNVLGIPSGVVFQGRVLAEKTVRSPNVGDSSWSNLNGMLHYWLTDEEPHAKVEAVCEGVVKEAEADDEGYFELFFDHVAARGAQKIKARLPDFDSDKWREIPVLVPQRKDFEHLIVCDIDDTVMETNVESVIKLFKTMFLGNILTRKIFPGMADFLQKVAEQGSPVFFVTSSPWNLRSFISSVFERHQIPMGGIFMTDWGLDSDKWFCKSHDVHKSEAIERILDWYPNKKVILIGDSGQRDPEIYVDLAGKFPDRVGKILIRNVSRANRRGKVIKAFADNARMKGINFEVFDSSSEMLEKMAKDLRF